MGNEVEKSKSRNSSHGRKSSSTSNVSSPLNPKAVEFELPLVSDQQSKKDQQEQSTQNAQGQGQHHVPLPSGPTTRGRGGQGRGRPIVTTYPLPAAPPGLGHHGQQYPFPVMPMVFPPFPAWPSLGGTDNPQPMFPMAQYPPYGSTSPPNIPFYGGQAPYQNPGRLPTNHGPGSNSGRNEASATHKSKETSTPPRSTAGPKGTQVLSSGGSRSSKDSTPSKAQPSPKRAPKAMTAAEKVSVYRREFEAARSFDDDEIYYPIGVTMCRRA
ncbi:hypothetical protein F5X98DRAFT_378698 [Xylaria grammica]|nr:hypothetical protein F5X98DRAFT_378698 [Xylaria grammica]